MTDEGPETGCPCEDCKKHTTLGASWDVLMSGRIRCPECGAHIFGHFKAKHMLYHVHRLDITADVYHEWRTYLGLL